MEPGTSRNAQMQEKGCHEERVDGVPVVFSAIQRCNVDEVHDLLTKDPQTVTTAICGLTPLHAACHLRNHDILKLLLDHGAEVGVVDGLGNTALHIAVSERWHEGMAELLRQGASPDTKCAPPQTLEGTWVRVTPLQAAVQLGDVDATKIMLEYRPDLSLVDCDQCSLLHLAAHAHSVEIVKLLLKEKLCQGLLHSRNCKGNTVIHAALVKTHDGANEDDLQEILKMFFEAGVDVNSKNNRGESPLFVAARLRLSESVKLLLSMGADPLAQTLKGQSVVHGACYMGCAASLTHLVNTGRLGQLITKPDDEGIEPFHYAVRSSSIDCCELLLNNGDHLTRVDGDNFSRCSLLLEYLPSANQLLTKLFDSHIDINTKPVHDPDFHITFDYSGILSPVEEDIQSSLIYDLNNSEAEPLLKHPLLESFLCMKWSRIRIFFYSNLFFFFLFVLLHTAYVVTVYGKQSVTPEYILNPWIFQVLHMVMYIFILVPELIAIIGNFRKYFRHWETLTKSISLITSACVVFIQGDFVWASSDGEETKAAITTNFTVMSAEDKTLGLDRQMAAISVFFGWIELMMMCGRLPILGSHVLIFTRIAKSAIKFIAAFASLLIGFSSSFMVLFHEKEEFGTFWTSLVKTLMMIIGEMDYSGLVDKHTAYISYIVLVVFLFLVCILMANLLIGLAVDDISNLERLGKIERLSKQASYVVTFEKLIVVAQRFPSFPNRLALALSNISKLKPKKIVYVNKRRSRRWQWFGDHIPTETVKEALSHVRSRWPAHDIINPNTAESVTLKEKLEQIEKKMEKQFHELFMKLQPQT